MELMDDKRKIIFLWKYQHSHMMALSFFFTGPIWLIKTLAIVWSGRSDRIERIFYFARSEKVFRWMREKWHEYSLCCDCKIHKWQSMVKCAIYVRQGDRTNTNQRRYLPFSYSTIFAIIGGAHKFHRQIIKFGIFSHFIPLWVRQTKPSVRILYRIEFDSITMNAMHGPI